MPSRAKKPKEQDLRRVLEEISTARSSTHYISHEGYQLTALDGAGRMRNRARVALGLPLEEGVCPNCFSAMFGADEGSCSRCGWGGAEIRTIDD